MLRHLNGALGVPVANQTALEFLIGYLIEKSPSTDKALVFPLIVAVPVTASVATSLITPSNGHPSKGNRG